MFEWFYILLICVSSVMLSFVGTLVVREIARIASGQREPNERDNHAQPTPKGGGIAIMISVIGFLTVVGVGTPVIWALILLTIVSIADDIGDISPIMRLLVHIGASILLVDALPVNPLASFLPAVAVMPVTVLCLIWFINLYNFMDGIDEITSMQTVLGCMMIFGTAILVEGDVASLFLYDPLIIVSAVMGFWYFNRHPASIFMGDSGSIPLGAFTGWLLLALAGEGYYAIALMIPSYYLMDATLTITWRALRFEKIWKAHSKHAYQRYVRSGRPHNRAVKWMILHNVVVAALCYVSVMMPNYEFYTFVAAYISAFMLYAFFMLCAFRPVKKKQEIIVPESHVATA